jgi:hypothetical protein
MLPPSPYDPFTPVDWRWQRASFLASEPTALAHEDDDEWVRKALDFQEALSRCRIESDRQLLAATMPTLWQANAVFNAQPPFLRWALEAYILAAAPFPDIAQRCGLMVEAVTAYERLFFAVSEHLQCTVWIVAHVIGEKAFYGLTERDLDIVWKLLAFNHGPVLLDSLVHNALRRDRPENQGQVEEVIAREMQCLLQRHGALASLFLPVSPKTALSILKLRSQPKATELLASSLTPGASESMHIAGEKINSALMSSPPPNDPEEQPDQGEPGTDKSIDKEAETIPYAERVAG